MAFNSVTYLVFYITVLIVSWSLVGLPRTRIWVVLLASLYFYASNNRWLLLLLLAATHVDFIAAKAIEDARTERRRKLFLALSITVNLSVLGFFKYFNFFANTVSDVARIFGVHLDWVELKIFLPIGISFYTFESMSYVIDVYQGKLPALRSWYRFAFFVSYFPHLIAGPIVRPVDFVPQIDRRAQLWRADLESALVLIFRGLFKKIVIADFVAKYANAAFTRPSSLDAWTALLGVYCFAFQIYYDFSGYSDIAIGCSRLEGFWLPDNFRRPYVAASITEFWRRWHISLSLWLRDYLYIPLGGGRMKTKYGVYRNLMITMILGGLWHGAAWHFVAWGTLQGLLLVCERELGVAKDAPAAARPWPRRLLASLFTFHLVCFSWILFRAESMRAVVDFLRAFGRFHAVPAFDRGAAAAVAICAVGGLMQFVGEAFDLERRAIELPLVVKAAAYAAVAACVTVFGGSSSQFIYFQF
jgi:D-alanyl-lipoteichoic acid acyltransferase DltB (MBOAT superfamily)